MLSDVISLLDREHFSPKHLGGILRIDAQNRIRFGHKAPLYSERIYVETDRCEAITRSKKRALGWNSSKSGKVLEHWPIQQSDIIRPTTLEHVKFCIDRWANGASWEHTGAYEFYERRGQKIDDVVARHNNLDAIFETVRLEGRLKTKQELDPKHFREFDGIRISIGPSGQRIFCHCGIHRFAMAIILGIRFIPAAIGCVYQGALNEIPKLRVLPQMVDCANCFA